MINMGCKAPGNEIHPWQQSHRLVWRRVNWGGGVKEAMDTDGVQLLDAGKPKWWLEWVPARTTRIHSIDR